MNSEMKDSKQEQNEDFASVIKSGLPAVILILIGGGLLANNFLDVSFDNWWALFLLVPVVALSYQTWRDYKGNGRLTSRGIGSLIGGLVITTVFATFLFDLDGGQLWPLFLIIGGITVLLSKRSAE